MALWVTFKVAVIAGSPSLIPAAAQRDYFTVRRCTCGARPAKQGGLADDPATHPDDLRFDGSVTTVQIIVGIVRLRQEHPGD